MKFIISFFLTTSAFASPINVYYEEVKTDAIIYKDLLMTEYQIPEELIAIKETKKCGSLKGVGKLDFCLKKNGDLLMVSVDLGFINESLKVFQAP